MANHSWVYLKEKMTVEEAEEAIKESVKRRLGDRLEVLRNYEAELSTKRPEAGIWWVFIPGSSLGSEGAMRKLKAPAEDFGFSVWLNKGRERMEFRHPLNSWEHWAQAVVREDLCQTIGTVWGSDHDDELAKGNPDQYKASYRAYITRNFEDPLPEEDREWIEGLLEYAPEGFRD